MAPLTSARQGHGRSQHWMFEDGHIILPGPQCRPIRDAGNGKIERHLRGSGAYYLGGGQASDCPSAT
jgi:hypothetical protein